MPFVKGQPRPAGSGRQPGSKNLTSQKLKEIIFQALEAQKGGAIGYMKAIAVTDPRAFTSLIGKLLPTQISGEDGGAVQITVQAAAAEDLKNRLKERLRRAGGS